MNGGETINPVAVATAPPAVVHHHTVIQPSKSSGIAILLEVLPGSMAQTFGIGNLYAGNTTLGLVLMFGYWFSCIINFVLLLFAIGLITWPLTWLAFALIGSLTASAKASASAPAVSTYTTHSPPALPIHS